MPLAQLRIGLPDGTWVRDVTTAHPAATVLVLAVMPAAGDRGGAGPGDVGLGVALLEIAAPELAPVVQAIADHRALADIEPLERTDRAVIARIETTAPMLLAAARASGVPIEPPVVVTDGVARVEVRATRDGIADLVDRLEGFGHDVTVEAIHDDADPGRLLSPRQRDLLASAVELGYYDTPRGCTLTELADAVGIAKSTCSETLHRTEEIVVKRFVDRHLAVDEHVRDNDHARSEVT